MRERSALRQHQELPLAHDLLVVHPDIKLPTDDINMRGRIPIRAGVCTIRIPKCNMHSGILLVLQNLANHFFQIDVRPNGKLADAIAVLVGMGVLPEIIFQLAIFGVRLDKSCEGSADFLSDLRTSRTDNRPLRRQSRTFHSLPPE